MAARSLKSRCHQGHGVSLLASGGSQQALSVFTCASPHVAVSRFPEGCYLNLIKSAKSSPLTPIKIKSYLLVPGCHSLAFLFMGHSSLAALYDTLSIYT